MQLNHILYYHPVITRFIYKLLYEVHDNDMSFSDNRQIKKEPLQRDIIDEK